MGSESLIETITFFDFILALTPIVVVLFLMVIMRWSGAKAGAAGWLIALILAFAYFGITPRMLVISQGRGLMLTIFVLYIVWMAILLFNVVKEAGAIDVIARSIRTLTGDRVLQLLILSWVFSGFLQSVSGFRCAYSCNCTPFNWTGLFANYCCCSRGYRSFLVCDFWRYRNGF